MRGTVGDREIPAGEHRPDQWRITSNPRAIGLDELFSLGAAIGSNQSISVQGYT